MAESLTLYWPAEVLKPLELFTRSICPLSLKSTPIFALIVLLTLFLGYISKEMNIKASLALLRTASTSSYDFILVEITHRLIYSQYFAQLFSNNAQCSRGPIILDIMPAY